MSYSEKLQFVSDLARQQVPPAVIITAIIPIQEMQSVTVSTPTFNFLNPVASHIYFIENISVAQTIAITGSPLVQAYDIGAVILSLCSPGLVADADLYRASNFFITKLAHVPNAASAGNYSIVFNGFDLTYA